MIQEDAQAIGKGSDVSSWLDWRGCGFDTEFDGDRPLPIQVASRGTIVIGLAYVVMGLESRP